MNRLELEAIGDEYPFTPKAMEIDGHLIGYLDEGPKDAPVVLMLHGNPTWSFYYRKLVLALRKKYRVVAPDHIGCGLSDKPQEYEYTLANHIANLSSLVANLGLGNVSLAVHDWGGAIGFGWAVDNPDKVRSLTIFNTAAFRSTKIPFRIWVCRAPLFGDVAVRGLNGFLGSAVKLAMATNKRERFTPQVEAGYMAPYGSWSERIAIHRFVQDIPLSPSDRSYQRLTRIEEGLEKFRDKTPCQIIWGMKDFCFTSHYLDRWTQLLPQAQVHRFHDAGHFVVEDAHEEIIPLMDSFLGSLRK
ncbi:MAG: alpha/beta fold hydrolase [Nitrospinota bacterium]|nr:alpha/beta fold hydrolase [Nitrospinota bacterium]